MPEVVPPPTRETRTRRRLGLALAGLVGLALVGAPLVAAPATANPAGTDLVISEVYARGGSAGASYKNRFIELYNPTGAAVALAGTSIQYRSPAGTANPTTTIALVGTVPANGHFLIQGASNGANGAELPTPDQVTSINFGAAGGTLFLAEGTSTLVAPATGSITANDAIIDLVGYGTSNTFEGSVAAAPNYTESIARSATGGDTDANGTDFTVGAMTPESTGGTSSPTPTPTPTGTPTSTPTPTPTPTDAPAVTIAELQGTGDASPLVGRTVTTSGVVTARYPSGGYNGYVIQTPGTGGAIDLAAHTASDAVFVYSSASVGAVAIGDHVQITGAVSEFNGLTELTPTSAATVTQLPAAAAPTPATVAFPRESAQRESLESMLIAPQGDYTITDTYDLNSYGSIGLATGTSPLLTPTEVARPGTAAYTAAVAENAARGVLLDDGASINFLGSSANKAIPLPYLTIENPVRVGAATTFTAPVVLDYRNNAWAFQPTQQLTAANAATVQPATFENTREAAPEAVGGDIAIASFNVLNYFPTTGDSLTGCSYYTDRDGNPVTVNSGCDARGAANADDLERQQAKIVTAINGLGASVVSLEEIENSAKFGKPRDFALATLTDALNAAAGSEVWAYVASPSVLPALANEDVIRTAFIYKKATVEPVGESVILDDNVAFSNARKPLAQEFRLIGDGATEFLAIVNHFKSKGSGSGADADQNDGQGASNASRVAQANALVAFAEQLETEKATDLVYLLGDFNAYTQEDPIRVLVDAGFIDQGSKDGKYSYSFDGAVGSLDHVFASTAGDAKVTGVDTWNINSGESVALEYSRYNYNATLFYDTSAYRSSDHDPVVVGLALSADADAVTSMEAFGAAQTVETGAAIASRGVEARRADGSLAAGADVTFTIDGPASFAGGALSATVTSNAAGVAIAPAITAGPIAGTVTITATADAASVLLPTITVVEPSAVIDVATSATTGTANGRVTVTVTATNNGDAPVQIVLSTKYGSKKVVNVQPGATVSMTNATYLTSIPAGTANVVVTAADGSQLTYPTPYPAARAS